MNRFLGFFPRRPVLCLMLTLCGCFLGAISLLHLPVGLMPNLANPGITIVTRYPGVSAEKIHQMITIPIERSVSDLGNIEEILSVSSEGESKINLLFSNEADIKIKMVEASERIDLASARFPRDVNAPYIVQYDPSDRPVFVVSFSSSHMDLKALREHIDRKVKLKFERVEGVSEVFVGGGFEREIQIAVDPGKLSTSGTTISGVQSSIAEANTYVPGGRIGIPRETSLYTDARLTSTTSLAEVPVRGQKGSWLPLDRLAHVTDSFRDPDSVARTNGEERVTIFIQKSGKANTLSLTEACETIVSGLGGEEFETHIVHNQGEHIRRAVRRVSLECIIGGIAALIVLQAFLQKRSISLLIGAAIPACILTTFFLMFLLGIDLNVMTLAGLALGAGMLVDNSVVVCESVERLAAAGADPLDAILRGAARVMPEIISSTLCTIVVFLPLLFTEPDTRRMYSGLALTVSASLVLSLVFALTVMPGFLYATSASWTRPDEGSANRLARVMRNGLDQAKQMYTLLLLRVFRRPKPLIVAAILLALGTPLFYQLSKKEYLDAVDSGQIEATADLKSGTHLERTVQIIQEAEAAIRRHPLVKEVSTKIEKSHATLHIRLRDGAGKSNQDIIEELRALTDHNEDAFIYYNTSSESDSAQDLTVDFCGDNGRELKQTAREAAGLLQGKVPGISQVVLRFREAKEDLLVVPDRNKAAAAGTSIHAIGGALRTLLSGSIVTKYYDGEREVDVRLRSEPGMFASRDDLGTLMIPGQHGSSPLGSLVTTEQGEGDANIYRKNKRTTASITIRVSGRSLEDVAEDADRNLSASKMPGDTVYAFGKEYRKRMQSQKQMLLAVAVSILAVYLLLGSLFESFIRPFLILLTVPLSIAAVLAAFMIGRSPLNMSVYIGMIMLAGIVVSNSILVASTIHKRVSQAGSLVRSVLSASRERLRPVLITTTASVSGMLPMALDGSSGAALWRPLALTVATGLTFSLAVSLLIVPLACLLYYNRRSQRPLGV